MILDKQNEIEQLQQQLAQSRYRSALRYSTSQLNSTTESPSRHQSQLNESAPTVGYAEEPVAAKPLDNSLEMPSVPKQELTAFASQQRMSPEPEHRVTAPQPIYQQPVSENVEISLHSDSQIFESNIKDIHDHP